MIDDRKSSPVWPGVAIASIALPVLYVLSTGPWNWFVARGWISQRMIVALGWAYWPIDWISINGPEPVWRAIRWYIELWKT